MAGVDLHIKWAAPEMQSHEGLLLLAMFEQATGLALDVITSEWSQKRPRFHMHPMMLSSSLWPTCRARGGGGASEISTE